MLNCIDKWGGEKMHLLFAEDHHDWLLAFSEIGKFKKFLDYRISDLGLNLSDYWISDSEKNICLSYRKILWFKPFASGGQCPSPPCTKGCHHIEYLFFVKFKRSFRSQRAPRTPRAPWTSMLGEVMVANLDFLSPPKLHIFSPPILKKKLSRV
jgi:hypothetical protein